MPETTKRAAVTLYGCRLVRHYEQPLRTSVAFIRLAMIHLMLRRLTTT